MTRIILFFLITIPSFTAQSQSQTQAFVLDNGMKVLVKEDHRAPVVVSMVWYNVGSADEKGGATGLAHILEHLMFKGTPKYPLGVFSKTIASMGGQENAFTNNDYTAYFEKIAAPNLATSFELEADRMRHLTLDPDEFSRELKVITEERRLRTDDNPQALTFERFLAAAHLSSPYHHPVIGWMHDIQNTKVDDARTWYDTYYTPNNATLVVVGDVNPNQVYQLAKQYFGVLPNKAVPVRKSQQEPPPLGAKSIQVIAPAQVPMVMLGYPVPTVTTAKKADSYVPYALEIIAGILDAGDSGRFTNHLVRGQQIASDVDVYYNLYARYQTQFVLYGTPDRNHRIDELKQAILTELKQLQTVKIPDQELQRIKTQIIAQKTFERDSIFGQAMELGLLETVGLGWETADHYVDRINKITAEEIQQTAQTYFNPNHLTEAVLLPETSRKGSL